MVDEAALLEKYRELNREQRGELMAIFATKTTEQKRHLTVYLALDKRIQVIERKLGCANLADARAEATAEWLIFMGFEKRQAKYQQESMLVA